MEREKRLILVIQEAPARQGTPGGNPKMYNAIEQISRDIE